MKNKFDDLNNTFNTNDDLIQPEVIEKKVEKIKETVDHVKKDYDYTRGNLYSIIEKGQEAINGILELAQESEKVHQQSTMLCLLDQQRILQKC